MIITCSIDDFKSGHSKAIYLLFVPRSGSFFLYIAWHVQWHFDIVSKAERERQRGGVVARYESKVAEYRATILKIKPHAISDSPSRRAQITFPSNRYKTTETCDSSVRPIHQLRPSSFCVYVCWKFVRTVLKIQRSRSVAMANGWFGMENAKLVGSLVRASKGRV